MGSAVTGKREKRGKKQIKQHANILEDTEIQSGGFQTSMIT